MINETPPSINETSSSIHEAPTVMIEPLLVDDRQDRVALLSPFQQAANMPWVAEYELARIMTFPYIRAMFALNGIAWGKRWRVWGMPMIQRYRGSKISIGDGVSLRSWRITNPLAPNPPVVLATRSRDAVIRLGEDVGMTGTTIVAAERIEIGNQVLIGANAAILDTDFHPLDWSARKIDILAGRHAPVLIEDGVFIGMNSVILKGVRIGTGAVIGAGSVVASSVPAYCIAAGNPARVIGKVNESCA